MHDVIDNRYIGSIAEVKNMSNMLLCIGYIDIVQSGSFIKIVSKNEDFPLLSFNTEVKISILNTTYGCLFLYGKVYTSSMDSFAVKDIGVFSEKERREYFRVKVSKSATMNLIEDKSFKETDKKANSNVVLVDISLGGFMIRSTSIIDESKNYKLKVELQYIDCEFEFVIVRSKYDKSGSYLYGCEYRNCSRKQQDILSSFIISEQRKSIYAVKNRYN